MIYSPISSISCDDRGRKFPAILFNAVCSESDEVRFKPGETISCVYKLKLNSCRGRYNLQSHIEHILRVHNYDLEEGAKRRHFQE